MRDIIVLLGAPGSGKGTQADIIVKKYGWVKVSTGDLFRDLLRDPATSADDRRALEEMKQGKLLSDDFIFRVTFAALDHTLAAGTGVVLDGAVRTMNQAEGFYSHFADFNLLDRVRIILIDISDDAARERLLKRRICAACNTIVPWLPETMSLTACPTCGGALTPRMDDTPEAIVERLEKQGSQALRPLFDFFNAKGLAVRVDGMGTIQDVAERVERAITE